MGKKTNGEAPNKQSEPVFSCYSKVDGECQNLLQSKSRLLWIILLIVDVITFIAYIILSINLKYDLDVVVITCSAVIFLACVGMFIVFADQIKKANKLGVINYYEFYDKTINAKSVKDGVIKGTARHFYNEFILVKRVKDHIFLSPTKTSFYPICVKDMTEDEYKTLVSLIDKMPNAKRKNI